GSYDHLSYDCPTPDKRVHKSSGRNDYNDEEEDKDHKYKKNNSFKKKTSSKDKPHNKKKGGYCSFIIQEWINDKETSSDSSDDEEKFARLAI
ncbi:hypothetical protein Q6247_25945, partial [Klebsiella pneumoniae]